MRVIFDLNLSEIMGHQVHKMRKRLKCTWGFEAMKNQWSGGVN